MVDVGWRLVIQADGWSHFKELISSWIVGRPEPTELGEIDHWWFRGQGSSRYALEASLDRRLRGQDIGLVKKIQSDMVESFKERAVELVKEEHSESDLLAILQHSGAPTRLLDWSTSPYVAAFFAMTSAQAVADEAEDCAVWAIATSSPVWASGTGLSMVVPKFNENQRALAQRGSFTLNSSMDLDIESYLDNYRLKLGPLPLTLVRFDIPRTDASSGLKDLHLMGITSESLFPGLEGTSRYAFFRALDRNGQLG